MGVARVCVIVLKSCKAERQKEWAENREIERVGREPRDYGRKEVREKGRRLRFWMGKEAGREKDMSVMQCMCCRYRARKLRKKKSCAGAGI